MNPQPVTAGVRAGVSVFGGGLVGFLATWDWRYAVAGVIVGMVCVVVGAPGRRPE